MRSAWLCFAWACLAPLASAWANPQATPTPETEAAAREAEMFGAQDDAPAAATEGPTPATAEPDSAQAREAELFGQETPEAAAPKAPTGETPALQNPETGLGAVYDAAMEQLEKSVTVGGQVMLWLDYNTSPLRYHIDANTGEIPAQDSEEFLSSPSLADFFLDARPTEHLRAYVRARYRFDFTVTNQSRSMGYPVSRDTVVLDQLWLKFDILDSLYITVGQQPIRWGASRFWNPTDFLNSQVRDPLAVFDERTGRTLLKLHLPIESLGWNFYAVANLDGATRPEEIGGAVRGEMVFGPAEVALSAALRKDKPLQLGLDASAGVWLFDFHLELALQHGLKTPFYGGDYVIDIQSFKFALPRERSREDDWILQGVFGAELTFKYTDQDNIVIGVEYFYNDTGYKTSRLYPYLITKGQFTPLYMGQHYIAAYVLLLAPGSWDDTSFLLSAMGNLSDATFITRLDYSVRIVTLLELYAFGTLHYGEEGGVFRFKLAPVKIPGRGTPLVDSFLEQIGITPDMSAALDRGVPTALFEAGVGVRLRY